MSNNHILHIAAMHGKRLDVETIQTVREIYPPDAIHTALLACETADPDSAYMRLHEQGRNDEALVIETLFF